VLRHTGAAAVVTGFTLSAHLSSRLAGVPLVTDHGGIFVPPVLEAGLAPIPVNPPRPELARLPRTLQRRLANLIPRLLTAQVRDLNTVADELGVQRVPSLLALMSGDLTLVTDLPEVVGVPAQRMQSWRARWPTRVRPGTTYRFTGPLFAALDLPVPADVSRFLDLHDQVVYLSPTSVDEDLLRRLVRSVRAAGAPLLVSATVHDIGDLADERTLVAGVLPNHLVMPRVAAAVTMGGQGSVQTALASGTPLVGLPFHGEQELNVAVAERLGAAIRLSPRTAGGPEITEAVRRVLVEPSFKRSAQHVRRRYAGVDGAALAAEAILEHLGAGVGAAESA
jgi:UDP:flavonoid glycosyltransferase YjiC (YdhE family)